MGFEVKNIHVPNAGNGFNRRDRILMAAGLAVANAAGGGAGQAVTVVVSGLKTLPTNFGVLVNPGQDATWWVDSKTADGFTIHLAPRLAANTLAAGTIDWFLLG